MLALTATANGQSWLAVVPFADISQLLSDVADGRGSEIWVGGDVVEVDVGAEEVVLPMGPLSVRGRLQDWRKVLDRELEDVRPIEELPEVAPPAIWEVERLSFDVLEAD